MKPLGLSMFQLTAGRGMYPAGGRLYVDITNELASPARREIMINVLGKSDPLLRDALKTIVQRKDFIKPLPDDQKNEDGSKSDKNPPPRNYQTLKDYDPSVVPELIKRSEASVEALKHNIRTKTGVALIDFVLEDVQQLRQGLPGQDSFGVIMTGMNASAWINEKMKEWLDEENAADTISQSVPYNITSEMGLALLDVADVIRPFPEVIHYLQNAKSDSFLDELPKFSGGNETRDAILAFLDKYGMRCVGEIDITRTRWSEKPATLLPIILGNIKNFEAGTSRRKFEQGKQQAWKKEQELLARVRQLPDGEQKAKDTKRMIDLVRNFAGYREYPKYRIINHYFIYKQALLKEAAQLVQANILHDKEDIYYLSLEELREVARTRRVDHRIISNRKLDFKSYKKLSPPRVITSDGEIITGQYKRENLPNGAIVGLAVSAGVVEGRARVFL
jgi:pyruvate,water dikinase